MMTSIICGAFFIQLPIFLIPLISILTSIILTALKLGGRLFDLLGGLLAKVLGGGQPDLHTIEFAGALLPVLLGILTIIPLYIAASSVFDRKTGLLGAFIFAVLPAHVSISRFGAVDHHVAETLLSTAAYAFLYLP